MQNRRTTTSHGTEFIERKRPIDGGDPSSLLLRNPFANTSVSGMNHVGSLIPSRTKAAMVVTTMLLSLLGGLTAPAQTDNRPTGQDDVIPSITVSPQIQTMELIRSKMETIATQLDRADTSRSVQSSQEEVLSELDRLIAAESAGQSSSTSAEPKESEADQGNDTVGQEGAQDGNSGAGGDESEGSNVESRTNRDLIDRAWGHLPVRVRERMQSALGEQFLPKYEKLIEAYYKRLADGAENRP